MESFQLTPPLSGNADSLAQKGYFKMGPHYPGATTKVSESTTKVSECPENVFGGAMYIKTIEQECTRPVVSVMGEVNAHEAEFLDSVGNGT
ncbi:hypothetical protein NDU88_000785 [Pleurodeles waltl]|uniref:Uncharacterized protein n=1 Tax=Pleurodeles waltl TaxID=8319 RepID=A0AAV7NBJ7_PLEWA|nr:hypothetical protein NDU88_000785 [Pleurodeles waltl]